MSDHLRRFYEKIRVDKETGCQEWIAALNSDGYGKFGIDGSWVLAHRFSWTLVYGSIPCGMLILHKCNNPKCVNPSHLYVGTDADNARDMLEADPYCRSGEANNRAKLSNSNVIEIRRLLSEGVMQKDIAPIFGVHSGSISKIANGKIWNHIQEEGR